MTAPTIRPAPVRKSITVKADAGRAFEVFTSGLTRWWPHDHGVGKKPKGRLPSLWHSDVPGVLDKLGDVSLLECLRELRRRKYPIDDAHMLSCGIALVLTERKKALPLRLQTHLVLFALGRKRIRVPLTRMRRDIAIWAAVEAACRAGGLRRTRNAASRTRCGCSVVSDALAKIGVHMTADAVAKACQRAKKLV
jgi:hypothetical protein